MVKPKRWNPDAAQVEFAGRPGKPETMRKPKGAQLAAELMSHTTSLATPVPQLLPASGYVELQEQKRGISRLGETASLSGATKTCSAPFKSPTTFPVGFTRLPTGKWITE